MYSKDLDRLREIAARPEEDTESAAYMANSNARLRTVAQAVLAHSERFNLDSDPEQFPDAEGLDFYVYAGSFLADLFALADIMQPVEGSDPATGGARNVLERALFFLSESEVDCSAADVYEKVRVSL